MIGLTDAPWLCIRPCLHSSSGIYVGHETRGRAVRDGAVKRRLASVAGYVREGELGRSIATPTGAIRASGRA